MQKRRCQRPEIQRSEASGGQRLGKHRRAGEEEGACWKTFGPLEVLFAYVRHLIGPSAASTTALLKSLTICHQLASSIVRRLDDCDSSFRVHRGLHAFTPWHNRARQAISRRFELGASRALPCEHLAVIRSRHEQACAVRYARSGSPTLQRKIQYICEARA
jgi:hypothetical protein